MMVTMGLAFIAYIALIDPLTVHWGLSGLWAAVVVFMGLRGLFQAAWYPFLERRLAYDNERPENTFAS
jgi:MATE family multidrug resistance protein